MALNAARPGRFSSRPNRRAHAHGMGQAKLTGAAATVCLLAGYTKPPLGSWAFRGRLHEDFFRRGLEIFKERRTQPSFDFPLRPAVPITFVFGSHPNEPGSVAWKGFAEKTILTPFAASGMHSVNASRILSAPLMKGSRTRPAAASSKTQTPSSL
jgi:hypothetical protein